MLKNGVKIIDLQNLGKDIKNVIERYDEKMKEIGSLHALNKFVFLGTGEYYGLAAEAMLKIKEMTLSWSEAYYPLEFRHGPKSTVNSETLVTFFWPTRGIKEHKSLLEEVQSLGAKTLIIGEDLKHVKSDYVVRIPISTNCINLPLYMPPIQLLGFYRAINLGLNPDKPKNLLQVVKI